MTQNPEHIFALLGSLGIVLLCGLPLLLFAGITFYSARKHARNLAQINSAVPAKIATLKPGEQLVRLEGVIKTVHEALDGPAEAPLALIRLKVEVYESDSEESGWRGAGDKLRASPFLLEDESGAIWVDPQGVDKFSLGAGSVPPTRQDAEAAAILTGIHPGVFNRRFRAQLWELRGGQRVTVIGAVSERNGKLVVGKLKKEPFIITPLLGEQVQLQTQQQIKTGQTMTILLGILGLLATCCGAFSAGMALIRMLQR